jgi:aldose 1-epimerase
VGQETGLSLRLQSGGAILDLLPETGGAVGAFSIDGEDLLRRAPDGTRDVLQTACFPLVPFFSRIVDGRFTFRGENIVLARNFGDHPHVLHGQGWQNPWRVEAQAADGATLVYEHPADAWPWDYRAEQRFALAPNGLMAELRLTNTSKRAMPASLGFHPYFSRPGTTLRAAVDGVWLADETCIPTTRAPKEHFFDLSRGTDVTHAPFVDNCHFGWKGRAEVACAGRRVLLTASPALSFLHVFLPRGEDFFCVEPVSAMPDFVRHDSRYSGLRVLEAGESFAVSMALSRF